MYTDAARTPGHRRHPLRDAPCQWDHHHHPHHPCDWHELWLPHHQQYYGGGGMPGCYPTSARGDHPSLDLHGRDIWSPSLQDTEGGRTAPVGPERGGRHRNPQRRPVFAGQPAPGDRSHGYPSWDTNPAQWRCPPPEPAGFRHYPSVREQQCGCVVRGDVPGAARPFDTRPPAQQPLPPPQFKGHRRRRIVKYVSRFEEEEVEEEEEEEDEGQGREGECCRLEQLAHATTDHRVHVAVPNGHYGPRLAYYDGWESDSHHQAWSRWKGGSEECCNGRDGGGPHKAFFSTEVPHEIHMNRSRRKGIYVPAPPENANHEPLKQQPTGDSSDCRLNSHHQHQDTDPVGQSRGKQDSVRDQIRQVVTDLEDVLGGLKQVHVEMKEVVEQIDRLTVNMDLSEDVASVTQGGSSGMLHGGTSHPGHLNVVALVANHDPASMQAASSQQHRHVDHVILRTNSPSPVHMASVVKTNRVAQQQQQPGHHSKDPKHERPRANGHPPHLYPPSRDSNHVQGPPSVHPGTPHPPPQSLDPTVVIGRSTAGSNKTQKPPPYPQNGRCGKGQPPPCQPPIPLKMNPPHPRRGRQSTSMV